MALRALLKLEYLKLKLFFLMKRKKSFIRQRITFNKGWILKNHKHPSSSCQNIIHTSTQNNRNNTQTWMGLKMTGGKLIFSSVQKIRRKKKIAQ